MATPPALSLHDLKLRARARLAPAIWDFIDGGSGSEWTRHENSRAFDRFCLRPSVLVDVSVCDMTLDVFGTAWPVPFGIAPMAFHGLATPTGELATVRAAGEAGVVVAISLMASRALAEIAATAHSPLWFQIYWLRDRQALVRLVRHAEDLGFEALMVTVDLPRMGRRLRDLRNGFALPTGVDVPNLAATQLHQAQSESSAPARHTDQTFDPAVTWDDVDWLRTITKLPIVLKGVLRADDARRAVEHGVDAIVVSNHGGRQLDGAPPALTALPEIAAAVGSEIVVLMDGGIRSGTDVLKALALGARGVFVGRPVLWGLASGGRGGAAAVVSILRDELENAMALAGQATLAGIDSSLVCPAPD